jgi:hypothetical protein
MLASMVSMLIASFCLVFGVLEHMRFATFYSPMKCSHAAFALRMSKVSWPPGNSYGVPAGTPPFGMFGHVTDLTSTCENPNEFDVSTERGDSASVLFLPNLTGASGKPYMEIARSYLTHDVNMKSKSSTTIAASVNASMPLQAFGSISIVAATQGYVPLYTKTVATAETCLTLFGFPMCGRAEKQESWCGFLGGSCFVQVPGTNLSEPAVCSYTRMVCRLKEADMLALMTPRNLGLSIAATMPCDASLGLPAGSACRIPAAPGIDERLRPKPILGHVDGPHPRQEDLDKASSAITFSTSLVIAASAVIILGCCGVGSWSAIKFMKVSKKGANAAAIPATPAILTSTTGKGTV